MEAHPAEEMSRRNDYFWNVLIRKAADGDRAALNVLTMIDEREVDPYDNYRLIELYDASKEG